METQLRTAFRVRFSRQEILRFAAEVAFLFAAMVVYFLIRGGLPVRPEEAFDRANQVIRLEDRLGIFVEPRWQESILDSVTLMKIANWVYVWGHLPVLIGGAVWLYLRNRDRYRVYRNALLISAFVALFGYGLFPVAPPRLLPEWGFVDTMARLARQNYDMQPGFFVNHYAAVPSLHFGWALLIGIALLDVDRNVLVRTFAVVMVDGDVLRHRPHSEPLHLRHAGGVGDSAGGHSHRLRAGQPPSGGAAVAAGSRRGRTRGTARAGRD